MRKIGIFGGTFDPIHHGHIIIANAVMEKAGLDNLLFDLAEVPYHKKTIPESVGHRVAMLSGAIQAERPRLGWSSHEPSADGKCYTIDRIRHLKEFYPDDQLFLIIGADSLLTLNTWKCSTEIIDTCEVLTALRSDDHDLTLRRLYDVPFFEEHLAKLEKGLIITPRIDISSSDIRDRVKNNKHFSHLVPECVSRCIKTYNLYGCTKSHDAGKLPEPK